VLAECGTAPDETTYALLSVSAVRDARKTWTAENHLFNTLHRGYTALPPHGLAECPFDFYKLRVNEPQKAKELVEQLTRATASPVEA
jgi:amidase